MRFNYEQLKKIWRAAAKDNHQLSREDLKSVKIDSATNALLASEEAMSLRAEGHFVYGITQIWNSKTRLLLQDSHKTDENIGTAFRDYLQALTRSNLSLDPSNRAGANTDLQLSDELTIPDSLLFGRQHAKRRALEGDLSVDAIMRDGDGDMPDELSEGENVPRSAEEQAILEGLDFGIEDNSGGLEDENDAGPGNLDFGSDLPYSSSPPHTPRDADIDVDIDGNSSPQVREVAKSAPRRRRGAPVDEIISIVRPRRAAGRIQRALPLPKQSQTDEQHDDLYIPLDAETEKLLDPQFIQEEMRRRRRIEAGEMDVEMEDEQEQEIEFGMLDLSADLSFEALDELEDDEEEEEDTPEMLENEQRKARATIRQSLRRKGDAIAFADLASTPKARACTFMEILAQAAQGKLHAHQDEAWGPISVIKA